MGKTTVAINLAYSMACRGWQTLLVDTDPQGSVGLSLSERARKCRGFYDALAGGSDPSDLVLSTRLPELKILPAGQLDSFFQMPFDAGESQGQIAGMLSGLRRGGYHLAIVDTAAGISSYSAEVLKSADYALVVQQAEPLGIRSLPHALQFLAELRRRGSPVQAAGILLSMAQGDNAESLGVVQEIRGMIPGGLLLNAAVPRDPIFLKASAKGVPLGLLAKKPPAAAIVFDQIAADLEARIGLAPHDSHDEDYARLMD